MMNLFLTFNPLENCAHAGDRGLKCSRVGRTAFPPKLNFIVTPRFAIYKVGPEDAEAAADGRRCPPVNPELFRIANERIYRE
jgi:hypothetical protein